MLKAKPGAVSAWLPLLEPLAKAAGVKPALVRLSRARVNGGEELQLCVAGRGLSDTKHNYAAMRRAVARLNGSAPLPLLSVKQYSPSCLEHYKAS